MADLEPQDQVKPLVIPRDGAKKASKALGVASVGNERGKEQPPLEKEEKKKKGKPRAGAKGKANANTNKGRAPGVEKKGKAAAKKKATSKRKAKKAQTAGDDDGDDEPDYFLGKPEIDRIALAIFTRGGRHRKGGAGGALRRGKRVF